jgi:hypothetical protein
VTLDCNLILRLRLWFSGFPDQRGILETWVRFHCGLSLVKNGQLLFVSGGWPLSQQEALSSHLPLLLQGKR